MPKTISKEKKNASGEEPLSRTLSSWTGLPPPSTFPGSVSVHV
ncbi:hypothetical protein PC116_g21285 [Phytophthora cactorum]|uniref:Uncharacterized protein n=1 Tax=Phytophthora cactorum TaxID=29920 RepID=A0A8T1K580_9STRA|nr:hypothetical protein PC114_g22825 [Phytophthora cactorum]KAG2898353.1 hypothetical protein PC117_g22558 [Phytophthora cactorum]KAG2976059.1 hypothetical protein PC119_g22298 [Phytophthora cactorum]KAG3011212.1 hypothetical protein PC120_g14564 [Phytophthora cactorum]KAG3132000.1 hypothetical protein C6341_g23095 [Phytophthora cactorum]